jgi:hypothetical protein
MKRSQREFFLPSWDPIKWTAERVLLLCVAVAVLIDSLLIPVSSDVDPGRSGAGILFLVLGFRAASKIKPGKIVLGAGLCIAMLTSLLNHRVLKASSWIWTTAGIILVVIVTFWGRGKKTQTE